MFSRCFTLCLVMLLAFATVSPAQEYASQHLNSFLTFVQNNHFSYMNQNQYNNLHPTDWAWVLGAAFRSEVERNNVIRDGSMRQNRMAYLARLWEELIDYVSAVSNRYRGQRISDRDLRDALVEGYNNQDRYNGQRTNYLSWLQINSNRISQPLQYLNGFPAGGRTTYAEGYRVPFQSGAYQNNVRPNNTVQRQPNPVKKKHPWKPDNKTWVPNIPRKR